MLGHLTANEDVIVLPLPCQEQLAGQVLEDDKFFIFRADFNIYMAVDITPNQRSSVA